MREALDGLADEAFAPLGDRPRYIRDGAERLRQQLSQYPEHAGSTVSSTDVLVSSENAQMASAEQWAVVQECQSRLPDATVVLRTHRISFKRDTRVPAIVVSGVLLTLKHGPFMLRREYALEGAATGL